MFTQSFIWGTLYIYIYRYIYIYTHTHSNKLYSLYIINNWYNYFILIYLRQVYIFSTHGIIIHMTLFVEFSHYRLLSKLIFWANLLCRHKCICMHANISRSDATIKRTKNKIGWVLWACTNSAIESILLLPFMDSEVDSQCVLQKYEFHHSI